MRPHAPCLLMPAVLYVACFKAPIAALPWMGLALAVLALKTHNKVISQGKGTFMGELKCDRSAPKLTDEGDPTAYADGLMGKGIRESSNKLVREGKLPFSSNTEREGENFGDQTPLRGPGSYDYQHLYALKVDTKQASKKVGTTAFVNSTARLGYLRMADAGLPGPVDYDPKRISDATLTYSAAGTSAFAGKTARCASAIMPPGNVGPETYDLFQRSIARELETRHAPNPKQPPFGVQEKRL